MKLRLVECARCGHKWPTKGKPQRCAACRTPYWSRRRQNEATEAIQRQEEATSAALEELHFDTLIYEAQEAAKAGVSVSEWFRGIPESERARKRIQETLAAAERELQALSNEQIEGIKKIYGFDPVLNPLHIVMRHAKQNLAGHGF